MGWCHCYFRGLLSFTTVSYTLLNLVSVLLQARSQGGSGGSAVWHAVCNKILPYVERALPYVERTPPYVEGFFDVRSNSYPTLRRNLRPYVENIWPYVEIFDPTLKMSDLTLKSSTLRWKICPTLANLRPYVENVRPYIRFLGRNSWQAFRRKVFAVSWNLRRKFSALPQNLSLLGSAPHPQLILYKAITTVNFHGSMLLWLPLFCLGNLCQCFQSSMHCMLTI